jgi:hypothetical protein
VTILSNFKREQEKEKTTQAVKATPHIKEKEPLWYRYNKIPQPKEKEKDQWGSGGLQA